MIDGILFRVTRDETKTNHRSDDYWMNLRLQESGSSNYMDIFVADAAAEKFLPLGKEPIVNNIRDYFEYKSVPNWLGYYSPYGSQTRHEGFLYRETAPYKVNLDEELTISYADVYGI